MLPLTREHTIPLRILFPPKALLLTVPLRWQVGQLKALLVSQIPTLDFSRFHLMHHGHLLALETPFSQLLGRMGSDRELVVTVGRREERREEFEEYYSSRVGEVAEKLQASAYQPYLHPNYYSIMTYLKPQPTQEAVPPE